MLQRDLAGNLAEQARREQAKIVKEGQQQPVKEAGAVALTILGDAQKQDAEMAETVQRDEEPDVTMTDFDNKAESEEQSLAESNNVDKIQKPSLNTSAEMLNKKSSPSKPATEDNSNSTNDNGSADDPNKDIPQQHDQLDRELFDKTPTTAGMKDIDFDNLFEDGDDNNDNNDDDTNNDNDNNNNNRSNNDAENSNLTSNLPQSSNPVAGVKLSPSKPEATTIVSAPASTTITTTSVNPTTSSASATETAASSFLPGLESYANNVNLADGATADIPLDLDFLDGPLSADDLNNNQDNVNSSNNSDNNSNDITSLDLLSQFPIGINANGNTSTGNQNSSNDNTNGNQDMITNSEALNQANLDDLFGFTDGTGIDGGGGGAGEDGAADGINSAFDIDGLGDFGDLLGNDGIGIDLGNGGGGGGGGVDVSGNGNGNDHGNNNNNGNSGNPNANTNMNMNTNGTGDGDIMLSEFDDIFGALTGP